MHYLAALLENSSLLEQRKWKSFSHSFKIFMKFMSEISLNAQLVQASSNYYLTTENKFLLKIY